MYIINLLQETVYGQLSHITQSDYTKYGLCLIVYINMKDVYSLAESVILEYSHENEWNRDVYFDCHKLVSNLQQWISRKTFIAWTVVVYLYTRDKTNYLWLCNSAVLQIDKAHILESITKFICQFGHTFSRRILFFYVQGKLGEIYEWDFFKISSLHCVRICWKS